LRKITVKKRMNALLCDVLLDVASRDIFVTKQKRELYSADIYLINVVMFIIKEENGKEKKGSQSILTCGITVHYDVQIESKTSHM